MEFKTFYTMGKLSSQSVGLLIHEGIFILKSNFLKIELQIFNNIRKILYNYINIKEVSWNDHSIFKRTLKDLMKQ